MALFVLFMQFVACVYSLSQAAFTATQTQKYAPG